MAVVNEDGMAGGYVCDDFHAKMEDGNVDAADVSRFAMTGSPARESG